MSLRVGIEDLAASGVQVVGHGEDVAVKHAAADGRMAAAQVGWQGESALAMSALSNQWTATTSALLARLSDHAQCGTWLRKVCLIMQERPLDAKSSELQAEIDRIAARLGVRPMAVGLLTNDGLNIFVGDDGLYHFTFYERGQLGFDRAGGLDDVLYWYCQGVVTHTLARPIGDRAQRFQFEYDVLSRLNPKWAKRNVRETAAMFRNGQPEDIALLPDIGESL